MNGNTGIQPTVELATTNGNGFYPYPMYNNGGAFGNAFGGDGIWAIVLLALLFNNGGWGGFGGNNWGGNNLATTDFVSSEFTQRDISQLSNTVTNGFGNLSTQLCNCCSDINSNIANGFYNTSNSICGVRADIMENRYANQLAESQTQKDILLQTTQLENQLGMTSLQGLAKLDECCCNLRAQGIENTQKILDAMNQNTIDSLRSEVNDLKNTITANGIGNSIVSQIRPFPQPAYITASPYQSIYTPYYNGCGCGTNVM